MNIYEKFLKYQKRISYLQYTVNILNWELKVSAPPKSKEDLLKIINDYETKIFTLKTSKKYGNLISELIKSNEFKTLDEKEQKFIENLKEFYEKNNKISNSFYKKYNKEINEANLIWEKAKEENNYEKFKPYLKNIIEMTKKYYKNFDNKSKDFYDILLNDYEKDVDTKLLDKLFGEVKKELLPLIKKQPKNNTLSLSYKYTDEELKNAAKYLLDYIGFDIDRGEIGIYPHGFTEKMGENDVRIAFKKTDNPIDFVTTIIHEGGHGIFEQNVSKSLSKYDSLSLDNIYALHESQSKFYENILGRNINFWIPIYDDMKKMLHLDLELKEFMKLLNTSERGLIRVEADELTYCMHIILRYEIEKDIFNDKITLDDLPKIWNDKMKEYLDVEVDSDSNGVMQDVHWSEGSFGYFPSYLLGSIYDGLFKEIIEERLGNIDEILKSGKIKEITKFLVKNVYVNGNIYSAKEILKKLGKTKITPTPFINYLKEKFSK